MTKEKWLILYSKKVGVCYALSCILKNFLRKEDIFLRKTIQGLPFKTFDPGDYPRGLVF